MVKQTVGIGSADNDGTGDPLRTAFDKINDNFDEVYSVFTFDDTLLTCVVSNTVYWGNSTVNVNINDTSISVSNSTYDITISDGILKLGNTTVNVSTNSTVLVNGTSQINSTALKAGSNVYLTTDKVFIGNTTVNSSSNSSSIVISNSTLDSTINVGYLKLGNSTVNTTVNSSFITVSSANVTTNTGLTLGSYSADSNGYSYLPNGLKMNWGWVSANSTDGNAQFSSSYDIGCYNVTATSNSAVDTYQAAVITFNTNEVLIRTANTSSTNVFWMAIGK